MKTVAVDFSAIDAGGAFSESEGIAIATIRRLKALEPGLFRFVFHTAARPHPEVAALKGRDDFIIRAGTIHGLLRLAIGCSVRADILYSPSGALKFHRKGMTLVTIVTDLSCIEYPYDMPDKVRNASLARIRNLVARGALFQCAGTFVADLLGMHFRVSPGACLATPGLVSGGAPMTDVREAAAGMPAGPFFLCSSTGEPRHNHETLIVAYGIYRHAEIEAARPPLPLVFDSVPDDRAALSRRRAEACGLSDVFFMPVSAAREATMPDAGALVCPTLHDCRFDDIARALRAGIAVIAHDGPGARELFGDACLYADARNPLRLAEAMARVSADHDPNRQPSRPVESFAEDSGLSEFARAIGASSRS